MLPLHLAQGVHNEGSHVETVMMLAQARGVGEGDAGLGTLVKVERVDNARAAFCRRGMILIESQQQARGACAWLRVRVPLMARVKQVKLARYVNTLSCNASRSIKRGSGEPRGYLCFGGCLIGVYLCVLPSLAA